MIQASNATIRLSIASDFTLFPGPREKWQGKNSAEEFLETHLEPKFLEAESKNVILMVDLDGTEGYSTAFLDGSFGALARRYTADRVLKTIRFITNDEPFLEKEIEFYMRQTEK